MTVAEALPIALRTVCVLVVLSAIGVGAGALLAWLVGPRERE